MPDRSEEDTLEDLEALDDEPSESGGSSTDADLEDLEAELGIGGADGEDSGDVGLDRDPSDEYADLLGDAPAESSSGAAEGSGTPGADEDDGGFLAGLFGGSESAADDSTATDREAAVDTGDLLDDVDAGPSPDADEASTTESQSTGSLRSRLTGFFSLRAFLGAALAVVVLGGVGRTFVPIVGGPVGMAVAAFLVGLLSGERRYLEVAVAGALVGALGAFASGLSVAFAAGATTRLLAAGGVGGLAVSLIGAYFGNDLRAGLVGGDEDYSEREL